jgi:hypothetical protein
MPDLSVTALTHAPRVSVVMTILNGETYLTESVQSVLGQTLEDLELIVVDDGSTDRSRDILESFARADPRVRVLVNDRNMGIAGARNRAGQLARAPYVAWLDGDDIAYPDRLSRQVEFLDRHPSIAAVSGAVVTIDANGRRMATVRHPTSNRVIQSTLLKHCCFTVAAATARRAAVEAVGGFRFREVEDYDLWLRISERFELANLREPVIFHRFHLRQETLVVLEQMARKGRAVCAAARARRESGVDPLTGVEELTPAVLDRLDIDEEEVAAAVEDALIARAAVLADLGHGEQAERLVEQARQSLGQRAVNGFAATIELQRAMALLRRRRPVPAIVHIVLAFRREPRRALSLVTGWLAPRVPGGALLRST